MTVTYKIVVSVNYTRKIVSVQAFNTKDNSYKHTVAEAFGFLQYGKAGDRVTRVFHENGKYTAMRKYPSNEWDVFVADTVEKGEKYNRIAMYNRLYAAGGFKLLTHAKRK